MLFVTVPAIFYLVMAIMFLPAVFFVGGIAYVIPKLFIPKSSGESFWFILFMGLHLLVYTGVYYGISVLLAKSITLIKAWQARVCLLAVICSSLFFLTQFRIYGGGGHGPIRWRTLYQLWTELNRSYGAGTVQIIYAMTIILLCGYLWLHNRKHKIRDGSEAA